MSLCCCNSLIVFIDGANAAQNRLLRSPNGRGGSFFGHIHQIAGSGGAFNHRMGWWGRRRWGRGRGDGCRRRGYGISARQRRMINAHPFWHRHRLGAAGSRQHCFHVAAAQLSLSPRFQILQGGRRRSTCWGCLCRCLCLLDFQCALEICQLMSCRCRRCRSYRLR